MAGPSTDTCGTRPLVASLEAPIGGPGCSLTSTAALHSVMQRYMISCEYNEGSEVSRESTGRQVARAPRAAAQDSRC
jgi:hypothetical protein